MSDLAALRTEYFDILVIGGGVVGAGIALDAVSRGLSVAIVEARDWASGTSSQSSKLIHGGLRYIRTYEFSLVREALRERSILLQIAPHLVRPTRFLYPVRHQFERPYVGAGLALYDLLARLPGAATALPRARHLGAKATRSLAPALRPDRIAGGVLYYDAQVDDARFVLALVRTAASYGARVLSGATVIRLTEASGKVSGATVLLESGEEVDVRAKTVISAVGVWSEQIASMAGASGLTLQPSKGVHLVVARSAIDTTTALTLPTKKSVLFVLPWGPHWIVGTTDTPWSFDPALLAATKTDIDYLLGELNSVLVRHIDPTDIESIYVGLRPLVDDRVRSTPRLSREHVVAVPRPGLVMVAGGKYTTYRVMAQQAVDAALRDAGMKAGPCHTADLPIAGADGYEAAWSSRSDLAERTGLAAVEVERLMSRYGALVDELAIPHAAGPELRLVHAPAYLRAEISYSVTHEGARHLDDVLSRRTRASIETPDRGSKAADEVSTIMAPLLGWDEATRCAEIASYRARVGFAERAERLAE